MLPEADESLTTKVFWYSLKKQTMVSIRGFDCQLRSSFEFYYTKSTTVQAPVVTVDGRSFLGARSKNPTCFAVHFSLLVSLFLPER
jgi:hypothetical protein